MRLSRSSGTTSTCPVGRIRPRKSSGRTKLAWLARVLAVVLLAWVLVPIAAQSSQAFAGTVAASAYASRDVSAGTTTAQSSYPGTPSASASAGTMTSTATANLLADTAAATANANGYGLGVILSLATATASCAATATGVTATAQAGGLTLLTIPLNNVPTGNIPPNTTVQLTNLFNQNVGFITYNEQTITNSGGQFYISATAAHIVSKTVGGAINGNVELAHVECGSTAPITPTVSSISPTRGPETGGTSVVVTGTNFLAVTSVKFGAANATSYTVDTLNQLTAVAPAGTGTQDILITNVAGTNSSGTADDFTYIPKPTITAITPTQGPTAGGTSVLITGTNLATTSAVKFGPVAATSFTATSTSITAVAPARAAGMVDVSVTTVGGTSDVVIADQYTYIAPPTVTNVAPSSGPLTAGNSVTITGTGFTGATAVTFGATNAVSYIFNNPSQITAVAPAGSAGTVDVTVTTVGGTSAISSADQYSYVAAPTVTNVAPVSGPTSAGTTVVITGTNLTGATAVKFGINAATGVTVNSATQITATAPAGTAGTVDVTVTTPGGTSATSSADQYTYVTAPTVTGVSPARGPLAGGTTVIITGTNLTAASAVKFGPTAASSYTVNSATQITAVAPARAAGQVDITVTTAGGISPINSADQYTYVAAPTVTNVSPNAGPIAGGTNLTITGTDFTGATAVSFGGTAATGITVSSDTQIVVTAPAHGAGIVDVVVTAPGGTSATVSADQFTYYPVPTVSAVSPNTGPTSAGTVVVITGTNFSGATAVKFGVNTATAVTINSSTQITATAPAGSLGTVDVTVTTPGGTSATSSADQFTYLGPPTVTAVSPARGPLAGGNLVVITGTGFSNASAVKFGPTNASSFTVNSATQITAVAPAKTVGAVDVTVTTIGGTSATSPADQYTYVSAPTVTAIAPTTGPVAGGTSVTITGTGFTGATDVTFGGVPASGVITVSSDTQITAVTPAHGSGTVDVVVSAPGGLSATSSADRFTYVDPPAVTGVSPYSGPVAGSVLQTVTITGTDFSGTTGVTFDGYPPIQILSVTATQIQVRGVPPHPTGPVHIQVTTPYGTSAQTPADIYTYQGLPTLTSVSPSSGALAGGNTVVLTGTGFTTTTNVSFGPNAASYTVNSDTQITATVPAGSAGAVNVAVTSLYGVTGGSNPVQYTYVSAPMISSISPATGPIVGGTLVTINGTGFSGATGVLFGGSAATGITVSSDTLITAFAPAQAAGVVDITVTTVGGTSATSAADRFTYVAAPTVTALSPSSGPAVGGTSVTITGTGFSGATAVSFGGTAASFTVNSGTQITAVTPAHAAGTADVTVTSIGGTSAAVVADRYTFVTAPAITLVSPQAGPLVGGASVTITGTGFDGATAISFGGTAATSFTVDSATQITASTPAHSAATVDVSVTTVGGTSATVPADRYTYQDVPSVTGLTPTHGPVAGGTLVTITGSGFTGATAVTFGGVPAGGVISVSNDTQIIAQAPAHLAGTVDVVVTAPGGTSSASGAANDFLYVGAPTVSGLSPVNGPIPGGTSVVITGTGFTTVAGATSVQFGGSNATSYAVNSDTQITAITPAHAAGPVGVTITTADGGSSTVTASSMFTYIAVPTVTSITPTTGPEAGGTVVTISGTALSTASSVRFGSTSASFTVNSDTSITATAPAGTGLVDVTVTTVGGTSVTGAADRFRYVGTPVVTGISPVSGPVAGGTSVTITGTQFYGVTGVTLGGLAATFTVNSPTRITAVTPAHAAGAVDLLVTTTDGGTSSAGTTFTYIADPVVSGVVPNSGPLPGGTVVVISGSGFGGATAVAFGSAPASSFTVNSATQITATSPAGSVGTVDVTVTGPFATSATSPADRFSYVAGPVLTSITPTAGPLAGGTSVTLTGTGFTLGSTVTFGSVAAASVQYVSPTQVTAVTPAGTAGAVDVVIATPYGQDALVNGYRYRAVPSVTSIAPTVGPEAGGTTVVITGTGFTDATAVRFGPANATLFTVSTDTSITATAPAGTGLVDVTVTGPGGTSALVVGDRYRYAPVPVLSAVSPTFGPTTGGTVVTLTGTGFTGATNVTMDGVVVPFSVVDDATITLTTPGGSGSVPIVVTTPGGSTAAGQFTYANTPTVSTLSPGSGPLGGGTPVTISGTGFTTGSSVTFGGTPASSVQLVGATELTVVTPAKVTPGSVSVTVTTPYGSASGAYRYVAAPTVTVVQPGAGPLAGGTVITVTGAGFNDVSSVAFGVSPATTFTVNSDTSITAVAPPHAAGAVDLTVSGVGGTSAISTADRFTYLAAPTVATVSPSSGPLSGGTSVVITGTGFTPDSTVAFGPTAATSVQYIGPTELRAVAPASASSGSVLARVTTAGGSDSGLFTYRDAPTVGQLQPAAGPEAGGTTVVITGSDFSGATDVRFGPTAASFTVDSGTRITATAPSGTASVDVRVTGPGGTSALTLADRYRYAPLPVVTSLSPTFGPTAGGTSLTVSGSGFTGAGAVTLNGVPITFVQADDSTITLTTPAGTAGNAALVVTTPGGSSAPIQFLYADAPTVSAISPDAGSLAGGTAVTISGADFTSNSTVAFGPSAAASVQYISPTQLIAVSPSRASAGVVNVVVSTPYGSSGTAGTANDFTYTNAPTVSSVSPSAGPVGGGTVVTISGSGLTGATSVTFDGAAASYTVNNDSTITAITPPGSAGSAVVRVTTVGGSDTGTFRFANVPVTTGLSPAAGPESGGTLITIDGSGFTGATAVRFGGVLATSVTVSSDTRISAFAPAGTGTVDVVVTAPGGTSAPEHYRYAPIPVVSQLATASGPVTGGTTVIITGTGFTGATSVTIGGVPVPFTATDDSTLTLTTPAGPAGSAAIEVTTPGGTSAPVSFTYVNAPTVTALLPDAGPLSGGTAVTITGADFTSGSTVTFGGTSATSVQYVSPTQLTATSPARGSSVAVDVIVSTPYGSSSPGGAANDFTYTNAPTISAVSPSAGPIGGGSTVTISGSGLTGALSLTFDGVAASYTVDDDATITAVAPPGSVGNAVVRVITAGGSDTGTFRYANAPAISSITPGAGPEAGGNLVTIDGSGFTGATTVLFGSVAATGVTVSSDTRITAFAPSGTGTVDVVVTAPGGTSAPEHYRYAPVPTVTQLSPSSGPITGGTLMTITGSGFVGVTDVRIGGAAIAFTVVNATTITVTTPAQAAGTASVVVTTPGGDSVPASFAYVNAPAVTALSPSDGPLTGGTIVTITGTDFTPGSTVNFGIDSATSVQYVSGTELTATAPAHGSAAVVEVVVTTSYGSSATAGPANDFSYRSAPALTSITPRAGPEGGGTIVTITGTDLSGATAVLFGTTSAAFTVSNDTSITATAPPGTGTVNVTVSGPGGTSPAEQFRYAPTPSTGSLSPQNGPLSGGSVVTISGSGFSGTTAVTIGGVSVPFTVVDGSTITFSTPAGAAGSQDVVVITPGGSSSPVSFTYVNLPVLSTLSPDAGPLAGGTAVTISGSNLTGATAVTFDGVAAGSFIVNNDSTITATTPASAAGSAVVRVTTAGGSASGTFRYAAIPTVSQIQPTAGPEVGGTSVVITGSGFTGADNVRFGIVAATFVVDSDTRITATAPAGTGTVDVSATTPGGISGISPVDRFRYAPVPVIGTVVPDVGPLGGGTVVTISGSGFTGATGLTIDAVPIPFTVSSDSTITFTTPAGTAGSKNIRVDTAGGSSAPATFTYVNAPTINGLAPSVGPLTGGTAVTITGTGFTLASTVAFGPNPAASVQFQSPTQLVATSPSANAPVTVDVVVTTAYGDSGTAGSANDFDYTDAPMVTGLQPTAGPVAGGTIVTVKGFGFTGVASVDFGSTAATSFSVSSDTEITAVAPAHPAGSVDVQVGGSGGTSPIVAGGQFRFLGLPTVSGLAPQDGPVAGGTSVAISGTGFTADSAVTFGGTPAGPVQFVSVNQIVVPSPSGSAGPVDVVVTTPGGSSAPGNSFEYLRTPVVSGVTPATGPLSGGTAVTISGTGFTPNSTVKFAGLSAGPVQFVSVNRLEVISPAGSSAGPVDVVVTTAGGASVPATFTYAAQPVVTVVQPGSGPVAGGTTVTVTGTGFTGATAVSLGTASAIFTVDSDTQITVTTPAGTGTVDVTVTTPGGISAPSTADQFTYRTAPQISGLAPGSGPATGGTSVTISGSGFTGTSSLSVGGVNVAFTVLDDSTITFVAPIRNPGTDPVTVTTPGGTASSSFQFLDVPGVSSVSPSSGPLAGGATVTIRGSRFTGATALRFGAVAVTTWSVTNDSTIIAVVPAGLVAGSVDVTVTAPAGTSVATTSTAYLYLARPVISAVTPVSGPVRGGTRVTIRGTGFAGTTQVLFGGGAAASYTVLDNQTITAVTGPHAAGLVDVVVSAGGGDAAPGAFTFVAAPIVTNLTPDAGPTAGGTTLTIQGSDLIGGTVTMDGTAVTPISVSTTEIVLNSPAHAAGTVTVTVTTAGGSSGGQFTYVAPQSAPVLSSVRPASGSMSGGETIVLTGVGFTGASVVRFGGVSASFSVVNDTTITAIVPAGKEGAVAVSVTTPNGATGETVTYLYVAPDVPPTITGVTPAIGPTSGGTRITITGTGFDSQSTVTFDGVPGTGVEPGASALDLAVVPRAIRAAASASLTVTTPAHAEGPATIEVTNAAGKATSTDAFTYIPELMDASVSLRIQVNSTTAVTPQGSLYAGLQVQSCSAPLLGASSVGENSAFCRYTAPGEVGVDAFTMQVTDALGEQAAQAVRITVFDDGTGGENTGGENTGGGGGNDNEGGDNGSGGGNDGSGGGNDGNGGGNDGSGGTSTGGNGGNDNGGGKPNPTAGHDGSGAGTPTGGSGESTGGGGGNDEEGATPTPTPTATPSPSTSPTAAAMPSSGDHGLRLLPGLPMLGLAALLVLLLVVSAQRNWWPWFLLARRRKRQDEEDKGQGRSK